jgi:uncharacterized membrane protein YkoI
MKFPSSTRSVVVGMTLAGSAGIGIGAAVAANSTTATATTQMNSWQASSAPTVNRTQSHPTRPATRISRAETSNASGASRPSSTNGSRVTLAEATRIASKAAGGRVTDSDEEWAATGLTYELEVARADGSSWEVVVDSRNGRVLTNGLEERSDTDDDNDDD